MRRTVTYVLAAALLIASVGCSKKTPGPAETKGPAGQAAPTGQAGPTSPAGPAGTAGAVSPRSVAEAIPADAAAVVTIQVKKIMDSKLLEPILQDATIAGEIKQSPVDPRKIERVTAVTVPRKGERKPGQGAFVTLWIVRFTEPTDAKEVVSKIAGMEKPNFEQRTHQGKSYYCVAPNMFFFQADDKTGIASEQEEVLQGLLSGSEAKSLLAEKLQAAGDADVTVVALVEPLRDLVKELPIPQGSPQEKGGVEALPDQIKSTVLTVHLSGNTLAKLILECASADSGKKVQETVGGSLEAAKLLLTALAAETKKNLPPSAPPSAKEAIDLAVRLVSGLQVTQSGNQVVVVAPRPEGLEKLVAAAGDLVRQWMTERSGGTIPPKITVKPDSSGPVKP